MCFISVIYRTPVVFTAAAATLMCDDPARGACRGQLHAPARPDLTVIITIVMNACGLRAPGVVETMLLLAQVLLWCSSVTPAAMGVSSSVRLLPIEPRVESLLARMSPEGKVAQLMIGRGPKPGTGNWPNRSAGRLRRKGLLSQTAR